MTDSGDQDSAGTSSTSLGGEDWVQGVLDALTRAAKDAHLKAYQTGTGVAYRRNGKFGVYKPDPAMYEDLIPPPFEDEYELPATS